MNEQEQVETPKPITETPKPQPVQTKSEDQTEIEIRGQPMTTKYAPHPSVTQGMPTERVTFDEALKIVQENYDQQKEHPITSKWLHAFLQTADGYSANVWLSNRLLYVYEGHAKEQEGGRNGPRVKPVRCLRITN